MKFAYLVMTELRSLDKNINDLYKYIINPFELLQNATKVGEAFTSEEISISEYLDQAEAEFMTSVFDSTLQYDIRI